MVFDVKTSIKINRKLGAKSINPIKPEFYQQQMISYFDGMRFVDIHLFASVLR